MNTYYKYFLLGTILLLSNFAFGQQQYDKIIKIGYGTGFPLGGLGSYIENKAYDGLTVEYKNFIKDNISIGFSSGWNSFSKRYPRQVYTFPNGEVSAVQTRYFRSIPLLITGNYYLNKEGRKFIPYAGGGLGAYIIHYEKWHGVIPNAKRKWSFGIRPEAGIFVPITEKVGVDFNLRYNFAIYSYNEVNNFHFPEGTLGLFIYLY